MAYRIDFTASNYILRSRRKLFLRLLLLATIGGLAWGGYSVYTEYHEPTLNMKLAEYEVEAHPIEEINSEWDAASKEYGKLTQYYRLVWAANPTNFLAAMSVSDGSSLGTEFQPRAWTLKTGGACQLNYRYSFRPGDKAEQVKNLESQIIHSVTSVVKVVDGKVDVQGVKHENLLNVNELDIAVKFSLPDIKSFPVKDSQLAACVSQIAAMRKSIHDIKISDEKGVAGQPSKVGEMMRAYLQTGRGKSGFPSVTNVINVSGWMEKADSFIVQNRIPDDPSRLKYKEKWNSLGEARLPWERYRQLDNDKLVQGTAELRKVADGIKRFKGFLNRQRVDFKKKLDPFVEAYNHKDVFNRPLIESDLIGRVAKPLNIINARSSFKIEGGVEPIVLEKPDEKYSFTWVRWTLSLGDTNSNADKQNQRQDTGKRLTQEVLYDCINRILKLGPGYVLEGVNISFDDEGNLAGAIMEGLLPVKQVEPLKEAKKNVN